MDPSCQEPEAMCLSLEVWNLWDQEDRSFWYSLSPGSEYGFGSLNLTPFIGIEQHQVVRECYKNWVSVRFDRSGL